ncbi:unnamed protein product, partial [Discosporangium mesarthrocarpum]
MIFIVDTRRPKALGLETRLQLENFVENVRALLSHYCMVSSLGTVEPAMGLIVPGTQPDKRVQVVCRGRPVSAGDLAGLQLVNVEEDVYGSVNAFGWQFLVDATWTALRIRSRSCSKVIILGSDLLLLAAEDCKGESEGFFTQDFQARSPPWDEPLSGVSLVFVEVARPRPASGGPAPMDTLCAWDRLHYLARNKEKGAFFGMDLIGNTPEQMDAQIRSWIRCSCRRKTCSLRLPATDTFSDVVVDIDIVPYLVHETDSQIRKTGDARPAPAAVLHDGFASVSVVQSIPLDSLDQGLCHGTPLLCLPSQQLQGGVLQVNSNKQLFMAVCAELDVRDTGLLLSVKNTRTRLQ